MYELVYPASIDYSLQREQRTISLSHLQKGKINFVSTFQTAPAQENPSTGKTLKNMQLVFTACRREKKKKLFLLLFFARWAHFFDFIARSHTLLSFSFSFCFSTFFFLLLALLLHTTRAMWLCSILLQPF